MTDELLTGFAKRLASEVANINKFILSDDRKSLEYAIDDLIVEAGVMYTYLMFGYHKENNGDDEEN